MLVEGRLEKISRSLQPLSQCGARRSISAWMARASRPGAANSFERAGRAPALAQRRAFQHDGAGIGPRHVEGWRHWATGVDPDPVGRPAEARGRVGLQPSISITR
jgi:hypothetical protein